MRTIRIYSPMEPTCLPMFIHQPVLSSSDWYSPMGCATMAVEYLQVFANVAGTIQMDNRPQN